MQTWAKRGIQAALVTGGLLMLGTGIASADENVNPDRPASPLDDLLTIQRPAGAPASQIHVSAPVDTMPALGDGAVDLDYTVPIQITGSSLDIDGSDGDRTSGVSEAVPVEDPSSLEGMLGTLAELTHTVTAVAQEEFNRPDAPSHVQTDNMVVDLPTPDPVDATITATGYTEIVETLLDTALAASETVVEERGTMAGRLDAMSSTADTTPHSAGERNVPGDFFAINYILSALSGQTGMIGDTLGLHSAVLPGGLAPEAGGGTDLVSDAAPAKPPLFGPISGELIGDEALPLPAGLGSSVLGGGRGNFSGDLADGPLDGIVQLLSEDMPVFQMPVPVVSDALGETAQQRREPADEPAQAINTGLDGGFTGGLGVTDVPRLPAVGQPLRSDLLSSVTGVAGGLLGGPAGSLPILSQLLGQTAGGGTSGPGLPTLGGLSQLTKPAQSGQAAGQTAGGGTSGPGLPTLGGLSQLTKPAQSGQAAGLTPNGSLLGGLTKSDDSSLADTRSKLSALLGTHPVG